MLPPAAFSKTVVIGAGLSGLTVAYPLTQAHDEDVEIYEARRRPGGRAFSVILNDSVQELGGEDISDGGEAKEILALAEERGLSIDSHPASAGAYYDDIQSQNGYDVYNDLMVNFPAISKEVETRIAGLVEKSENLQEVLDEFFKEHPQLKKVYESRITTYEGAEPKFLASSFKSDSI